ncbi:hypothetical protein N4G70_26240 [Streptomyces sp. ASQP_92]|uniref:hypothetical protein n=1 Tax=Streptomyces sp. ASQP_92 TaxID=2979116 RepID=UPI0021C06C64|nr:hypothetical protein [Streptomyces sp. ASQP_92]MCT9092346.1 hypothetical protein [Streptomyces sp. ASQP_92]
MSAVYVPEWGQTVYDSKSKKTGRVMGHVGPYVQVRPLNGGKEWDADPDCLTPAPLSDALRCAVGEQNARSHWGI